MSLHGHFIPWTRLYEWLVSSDPMVRSDLIFVLAGKQSRKVYGLQLFRRGLTPRILLSVGRFEIRPFARLDLPAHLDLPRLASAIPPARRHFFVLFEGHGTQVELVSPGRFGTMTEVEALARWLSHRPHIESILVISSATHLRRLRVCCRALLPRGLRFSLVAVPESGPELHGKHRWQDKEAHCTILAELVKVPTYRAVLWFLGAYSGIEKPVGGYEDLRH